MCPSAPRVCWWPKASTIIVTGPIGCTKAGWQRWVGNYAKRRGEFLHQWWQRFTKFASMLDICLYHCGGHLRTLRPVVVRQVFWFLLANHRRPFKRPQVMRVWPRFQESCHLIGWKGVTRRYKALQALFAGTSVPHFSLVGLMQFNRPSGQLACWFAELAQYEFQIALSDSKHLNGDGMSSIPMELACDCYITG